MSAAQPRVHLLGYVIAGLRSGDWLHARRVRAYLIILAIMDAAALIYAVLRSHGILMAEEPHITTEFMSFYSAGRMADSGAGLAVYDIDAHHRMEQQITGDPETPYFAFFYPPVFMLLCMPLALLPYLGAFAVWVGLTAAFYLAALKAVLRETRLLWPALVFPAFAEAAAIGENSLLSAGLFGFGLTLIDRRPYLAGAILGALCYKPHFGLPVLVALLAGRRWAALAGGAGSVIALCGLATLVFGWPIWPAYLTITQFAAHAFEEGKVTFTLFMSTFGAVRLMGGGIAVARAAQIVTAILALGSVAWVWYRPNDPPIRNAMLCAALPVVVPVMLDYDMTISCMAIAWAVRDGMDRGFFAWEKGALLGLCLGSLLNRAVGMHFHIGIIPWVSAAFLFVLLQRSQHLALYRSREPVVR